MQCIHSVPQTGRPFCILTLSKGQISSQRLQPMHFEFALNPLAFTIKELNSGAMTLKDLCPVI